MENLLQLILKYGLNKEEAMAWRLALIFLEELRKYFPEYKMKRVSGGDPRKKEVWKYCRKLLNDTSGKVKLEDYRNYIKAQFTILKSGIEEPYIHPNCLVGVGAWKRWMVWKKYFDNLKVVHVGTTDYTKDICQGLAETHYAITLRLGKVTKERISEALKSKLLLRLSSLKVISPYFLVLSPTVKESGADLSNIGVDEKLYRDRVTKEAEDYYKKLFGDV